MLRHLVQLPSRDTSDIRHEADFRERRTDVGYRPIADMRHALAPSHLRRDFPLSKPVRFRPRQHVLSGGLKSPQAEYAGSVQRRPSPTFARVAVGVPCGECHSVESGW